MSAPRPGRPRRGQAVALTIALAYGAALPVAAWLAPFYSGASCAASPGGPTTCTSTHASLVAVDGWWVLLPTAVPLIVGLLVGGLLWAGHDRTAPRVLAWVLAGLLGAFNLVAMLSIGVLLLPVTVCLLLACAMHRPGPADPTRRGAASTRHRRPAGSRTTGSTRRTRPTG